MEKQPFVSVVVPVFNAGFCLGRCLEAIKTSSYPFYEIIVVDDGSTDDSADIARRAGAIGLRLDSRSGPAAARNFGAKKARGDVLLFVDSDILIQSDTIAKISVYFSDHPDIAAVFGSYDSKPDAQNFLSQYKNLVHHFVHQQSKSDAVTFWAGCGAVRKDVFCAAGGFDQKKYTKPCIEDIELGCRLRSMGHKIFLHKDLQVKHLKEWRFKSLLRADIFQRAVPWTRLILERKEMIKDLNLQTSQKISACFSGLIVMILLISVGAPGLIYYALLPLAAIMLLNRKLLQFFLRHRGPGFTLAALGMQLLFYLYSGITFVALFISDKIPVYPARQQKPSPHRFPCKVKRK